MRSLLIVLTLHAAVLAIAPPAAASDHADPIDPLGLEPLEPVITDLFVFPTDANDAVVRGANGDATNLVVILCVRRALTDPESLDFGKYTYTIHIDTKTPFSFDATKYKNAPPLTDTEKKNKDAIERYGGEIDNPGAIDANVEIAIRLAAPAGEPKFLAWGSVKGVDPEKLPKPEVGIYDDPFIFPRFSKTNVVGMVQKIPLSLLPQPPSKHFLVWATTKTRWKQIDHVGRSLRTQNPRFGLLNTLHPSKHVEALRRENDHPSLARDLALRFDLASLFRYRDWDFAPDVLIYTREKDVAFPNGRRVGEDVVGKLALVGDTLAFELSYGHPGGRQTSHVPPPRTSWPYLLDRLKTPEAVPPYKISLANKLKLLLIIVVVIAVIAFIAWWFTRWYCRRKHRLRYL